MRPGLGVEKGQYTVRVTIGILWLYKVNAGD